VNLMADFEWNPGKPAMLNVAGRRLEAVCFGPSPDDAPTIVMLHEGLGCVALWRDFPQKLASETGMGVFVYSRAGYGQSDPADLPRPLDYMSIEAFEVLPRVLDSLRFQSGILLGHSDGASIAAIYAGGVEDHRVRGLVLIAPHFFTEEEGLSSIAAAAIAYENGDLREKLAKYHNNPDNAFWGWNKAWLDPGFRDWNIADAIDYWRIPVLAVQGGEDQYGTLGQISEIETRIYSPVDVAILENCGHSPHIEQPEALLKTVGDFCTRLKRIENEPVAIS